MLPGCAAAVATAWAAAAAAADKDAPFLCDLLVVVVVAAAPAPALSFLLVDSAFREDLDLDMVVPPAASAKVARAGVEGLLARPLLVVTVVMGVGGSVGVSFLVASRSSIFTAVSFLWLLTLLAPLFVLPFEIEKGSGGGGGISVSGLDVVSMSPPGVGKGTPVSFCVFVSAFAFPLLFGGSALEGFTPAPFACLLFEAAEVGRCRAESPFGCVDVEFFRAREEAGRG